MTKRVDFTDDEIKVTIGLFDAALRAQGLQIAGNVVHLTTKLQNAMEVEDVDADPDGEIPDLD